MSKYKAIDYKRKLLNKNTNIELDEEKLIEPSTTEDRIIMAEDMDTLKKIINEMKDIDKKIFIKRYILDESISDISETLGFTRGAIDNRLSRGRKIIKNKWVEIMGR